MARASARTTHEDAHDEARHASSAPNANGDGSESLASNDEEAIRAKLRESGWEKKTRKEKDDNAPSAQRKNSDAKDNNDRDHDRERRRGSGSARKERRSRSRRRGGDRDRDDRRDRDRDSRRHRDRSAKRGKPSSRRRSSRSRSTSKSHSRSPSKSRRVSSSHHKRRGASPSRSVSRGRGSGSKKSRAHGSKSRSLSLETSQKKKKNEADTDTDPEMDEQQSKSVEQDKVNEMAARVAEKDTAEDMDIDEETAGKKPEGETSKERASSTQRKGRKSSHHSRSKSRSPSRSSRRRRHRSRSRSPSRNSRRRRSSRSRSRSRGRRGSDRRRRRSYTRSRSPSHSRRRRRSSSKDKKRRDANSSPEPHEHPPGVPVAPPLPVPAPVVNPTITQLMQQYPTMSLQDIIAKMQASNVTMAAAVSQKPARELYVGNLPPNVTGPQLQEFLGTIIQQVGLCAQPGNPILNTWISTDGHFAFCEMRSVEECNLALLLNQLSLLGQPLKFGRPRSFMGPPQPMPVVSSRTQTALANLGCTPNPVWFAQPNLGATGFGAAPALPIPSMPAAPLPNPYLANPVLAPAAPAPISAALLSSLPADADSKRLLMSNIPVVLVESQVKELVEPFGELKSFTLLMDKITGASTGNALFEYKDDSVAEEALQGLNGLDIGGIPLSIRRAPQDANGLSPADETSVVIKLANMVSLDELKDDDEFSDLKEDVEEECKRFGKVVDMVIPRPQVNHRLVVLYRVFMNANLTCGVRVQDGESVPGVGNIYVRFNEKPEAASAMKALSGRKFGGNIVKVTYYPLAKFESKEFA